MSAAMILTGGAALLQALGSLSSGNARDRAAQEAALAREAEGRFEAGSVRRMTERLIGEQQSGYASSGVAAGFGTPVTVASETRGLGKLEELAVLIGASSAASSLRREGAAYKRAGQYNALASLLSGAGKIM